MKIVSTRKLVTLNHKVMATWWREVGTCEPGWTRLPSSVACCRRLKGPSRSVPPGLASTVSRSPRGPEKEAENWQNDSLRKEEPERSWHLPPQSKDPAIKVPFGSGCKIKNERKPFLVVWFLILENMFSQGLGMYSQCSREAAQLRNSCHHFSPASQHRNLYFTVGRRCLRTKCSQLVLW